MRTHVVTIVTRFQAGGGVVALRGAQALDPDRFRVTIVAGSGDRLLDEAERFGFEVHLEPRLRAEIAPRDELPALRRLAALLERLRPEVVHTHCAKAGTLGRLAARRAGVGRIVHTYHGFPFHEFQSAPRRAAYIGIERRLGRFTDVGLCVGSAVAVEALRRRLIAPERVRTIGVAVDPVAPVRTPVAITRARSALGVPDGTRVVGAVGRLAYQKAPEHFVEALARLNRRDVVGVWIGGGELEAATRRAVRAVAGRAQIILAGERTNVRDLLPAFDLFALPSRYEGLPVAIVEAITCGVPVVATAVNAVPDVIVPGSTGLLVPPQQPALLATAIGHLLDHPGYAAELARAATERLAGGQHSVAALGQALSRAYLPAATAAAATPAARVTDGIEEPACA